eukprot:jgi/Chlat1/2747/Chrsp187S02936
MFRNQYDTDVTTWSPAGRLHQIEYAMEAVKQGSCAVGLQGKDHIVLTSIKRDAGEMSSYQRKLVEIDTHLGIAIAGLNADGRVLSQYMRNECINHKFVYESPFPVGRLVLQLADRSQVSTQRASKRPYGVGLLVAGHDKTGPHLFQTCPSGNYFECLAMAIGSRSQASKTYLERKFETFKECTLEELIMHGLRALKESVADGKLTTGNSTIAIVGKDQPFKIIEGEDIKPYIEKLNADAAAGGAPPPAPDAEMPAADAPDVPGAQGAEPEVPPADGPVVEDEPEPMQD